MNPVESALVGIGGDGTGLIGLMSNPIVVVLAWVVPVAVEVGLAWWAIRAWQMHRARTSTEAWDATREAPRRRR